jgi:hypothetical protein
VKRINYSFILSGYYFSAQPSVYLFTIQERAASLCRLNGIVAGEPWKMTGTLKEVRMERKQNQQEEIPLDNLTAGMGEQEQPAGAVQSKYGLAKEAVKRQVDKLRIVVGQFYNSMAS